MKNVPSKLLVPKLKEKSGRLSENFSQNCHFAILLSSFAILKSKLFNTDASKTSSILSSEGFLKLTSKFIGS